jgi:RNA polymerase sigma-70 factor (ECF subfamily)
MHEESRIEDWLAGIARNHLRNFLRKRRMDYVGGVEDLEELIDVTNQDWREFNDEKAVAEFLSECMSEIDGPSKELLEERYMHGKSVKELAENLGRGYSAVTMHLHRIREVLGDCIKRKMEALES